jgi:hypothetical protein
MMLGLYTVGEGVGKISEGQAFLKRFAASSDRCREQRSIVDLGFCKE